MGLDVTAYRRVTKVADWPKGAEGIDDVAEYQGLDVGYVWNGQRVTDVLDTSRDFPQHAATLSRGLYSYDDRVQFRAGSYSGYGAWRDWLSLARFGVPSRTVWQQWPARMEHGAAWLINFSDCEGYIDAPTAARILADLQAHAAAILAYPTGAYDADDDAWYGEKFRTWIAALEAAADGGLMEFH